ncbi:exodeoxyribonuclease I [Oleiphilus sp. HI0071]|jgi:exodeoxyribonuclease-1|uniref:exodeoxyribonuclease I n=1 Tax=Oleiphilus sp. HI0080 TaxID=1822255 RepID=UPI0007C40763|nr:exodeoxyribonuclease I [Oleiphilus sp. HI0080]KZY70158.1 exodeoxyribonuclease I [Oleiphilus sp. HI0065]KZY83374.1 exodeoxyribonuclease I [Oleiphilus sp. HI0071]KZY91045.1 exodeoxyribonuclease I [Oleiphilus sp. HI0073]KZZ42067.1 exodeoxyribonuclease I [Oleiphilus sp. HI0118]KZZ51129.1 exodeoxyribonuclease I [Oleiphilus sp. HI0122]
MQTIFWHDYETFGADPQRDRPCQFAGIRTDLELNVIDDPVTFYAKPTEDYLPAVQACLVTGITPQEAAQKGCSEAEFAARIQAQFTEPGTCVAGYNSVRFDDEVSRNLFYRNFFDPYEREWKNGNSRWDIIDVVRLTYALRPEGIEWPVGDDGKVSFRLEKLTEMNGIAHEAAHDAMSDVYATIALAKLIKDKQPKLYKHAFDLRTKAAVKSFFEQNGEQPFIHVSSKIPVAKGCCAMMYPLMPHPTNQNAIICFDLRQHPSVLMNHSADQLREMIYAKTQFDELGRVLAERPAIKLVHLNKCPMVAPAAMIKVIPEDRLKDWDLDLEVMREHLKLLRSSKESVMHVKEVFESDHDFATITDPDLMIYSGGFFSPKDKTELSRVQRLDANGLADYATSFEDARLDEMLFRYKARSFPDSLSSDEREKWLAYCQARLLGADHDCRNFSEFSKELKAAAAQTEPGSRASQILEELQLYAESIYPY